MIRGLLASAQRAAPALAAGIAMLACLVLAVAGCGDDSSPEVTVPTITAPGGAAQTPPPATTSVPEGTTTGSGNGGTGTLDPAAEDSETNDKPPPAGSPEAAFEKACEQNPAACG